MNFSIEKSDTDLGLVRTAPLSGGQFFEFWRKDNIGSFNFAEANLQSIQRTVELQMADEGDRLCIDCTVTVRRLALGGREVSGTSRAREIFTESKSSVQRLEFSPLEHYAGEKRTAGWIDLGRDTTLESHVLVKLDERLRR
jgi:hypothetical protein